MSKVVNYDSGDLGLDDIVRLVSGINDEGNFYIRVYNDGTDPESLSDCADGVSSLDVLRGALVTNDEGEFALNVSV